MEILILISLLSLLITRQRACFIAFDNDVAVKKRGIFCPDGNEKGNGKESEKFEERWDELHELNRYDLRK